MNQTQHKGPTLSREMGLLGLAATGICSMIGAGVNIIPFMIQRNVPGIGSLVLPAYFIALFPALLAAFAYAILGSAMPRAGGSYLYASRAIHPFFGFIASFSQWFGLSIAAGVVAYVLIPFLRDIATALSFSQLAIALDSGPIRVALALAFIWIFTLINLLGIKTYERTLIILMFLMFIGGAILIPVGFMFNHSDFITSVAQHESQLLSLPPQTIFNIGLVFAASAVLFSTFIGFDAIAQAGGEAKKPNRTIPLAISIAFGIVATYYILFTAAVYHAVPWNFIAERGATTDLTAPGLLGYLLSPGWTVVILAGAAIALANSIPGVVLASSRLMFSWAEDGVFPRWVGSINKRWRTPHIAILLSSFTASAGIFGCYMAGDFFLGVDILVTSMLVNFILMCLSVLALPHRNPALAKEVRFMKNRHLHLIMSSCGAVLLGALLVIQIIKDLRTPFQAWYFHSTYIYLLVTGAATVIFLFEWQKLRRKKVDIKKIFSTLPPE